MKRRRYTRQVSTVTSRVDFEPPLESNEETQMSNVAMIVGAVVIVAILIVAAYVLSRRQQSGNRQRTEQLRSQFGTEYDRAVVDKGDIRHAEAELTARQKRVAKFDIKPLTADEGKRFSDEWQVVKASFVDDPSIAVRDADALLGRVMEARGYPVGDFDQRYADVSVDHPAALDNYRAAHEIALLDADGKANTEDLRQAVISEHALFGELVAAPNADAAVGEPIAAEVPVAEPIEAVETEPETPELVATH